MAVVRANNQVVEGDAVVLHDGTRTGNGSGVGVAVELHHTARLTLNVTAASGTTPSLTVTVETSSGDGVWTAHTAFAAATGTGAQRRVISGLDRFVRVSWAIAGTTPSFTFTVSGELI